ncbi:MAG: PASTA domain-containing protein [Prevotella sp.]|nr:PASTA domain-containing protein [Prevotella sp.]
MKFFKKFGGYRFWGNLLAMALVSIGLIVGLIFWLNAYTHHGQSTEVPDLYGIDFRKAVNTLDDQGLRLEINDSTYNQSMPAGCIMMQTPAAGMQVKEGRIVYVTINSLTKPTIEIPDIIDNMGYRQAQAILQSLGFKLTEPKLNPNVDKDWVCGLDYKGKRLWVGDKVPKGAQLTLIIGSKTSDYGDELLLDEEDSLGLGLMSDTKALEEYAD